MKAVVIMSENERKDIEAIQILLLVLYIYIYIYIYSIYHTGTAPERLISQDLIELEHARMHEALRVIKAFFARNYIYI
jgi:hypothetical protein